MLGGANRLNRVWAGTQGAFRMGVISLTAGHFGVDETVAKNFGVDPVREACLGAVYTTHA